MAETLVEIELVDRALALAAQIFTSVLPVIIAASAFGGSNRPPTPFAISSASTPPSCTPGMRRRHRIGR
ncbi:hypothetical protein [Nocardia sp. NPDC051981]|uniref:hypothetical protein n=1 Tax=Nocardia sp. NPDC051981 TaxID=3155417 RepID=UPI003431CA78